MRLLLPILSVVALAAGACSTEVDEPAPSVAPTEATDGTCQPRFARALDAWAARGFSGTVAIHLDGQPVCHWAGGAADPSSGRPNDVDTVFSIGSIAKTFTAATVLDLVDEGVLTLDDTLGRWIPELDPDPGADITLAQLLAHTGGLGSSHGEDHRPFTEVDLIASLSQPTFEPGQRFAYSNTGYSALALVIERATARPFRQALAETVLGRANPEEDGIVGGWWDGEPAADGPRAVGTVGGQPGHSGDFDGPHWALDGNGGLAMSTADVARWVDDLVAGEILAPSAVDTMFATAWDHGDGTGEAFGWVVSGEPGARDQMFAVSGGGGSIGHEVGVVVLPELDAVVAVAANSPTVAPATIGEGVITALLDDADLEAPPEGATADQERLEQAAGRHVLDGGGTFVIEADGSALLVEPVDGAAAALFFPAPPGADPEAHGAEVEAFLSGATPAGRKEQAALEDALGGPVTEIELRGTIWFDGEFRTYVIVRSASAETSGWLALEASGGLAAAEVPADRWPTVELIAVGPTRFAAADDRVTPVVVDITDPDQIAVEGPDGVRVATPEAGAETGDEDRGDG